MTEEPREPKVSQRYRELNAPEPRSDTDAAILAAARRAAEARPAPLVAPTGRRRWYFPVAAAAVIALAIAVTLRIERQTPDLEDSNIAAIAPAPPQAAKDDPAPKASAQEPFVKPQEMRERKAEPQPRVQAFGAVDSPERWLERIAELRSQGRDKEADESLVEFRKRFPDYRIPEAMLQRVEKK